MPTQEEMLQQVYTGESTDPFEYYTKPWRKRYPYDQNMFPSIGLDMGGVPFGGALTGGESPFYLGQGQGGETNSLLALATQLLPKLAQTGMSQLMPTQQTTPNARAVFNVDEGMANLLQPTMFNANAELYGTEPWMTESYPSNFQNSIYDIPSAKAIFNVDEGMPNLPGGGGGGGIGGLLNNNLGGLGGTVGGMIPKLFGYDNPALGQIGGTLGGLGGAYLSGTGLFNPINQGAESLGNLTNAGGMPGLSLLTNPGAGMGANWKSPWVSYAENIPVIGIAAGLLGGLTGGSPLYGPGEEWMPEAIGRGQTVASQPGFDLNNPFWTELYSAATGPANYTGYTDLENVGQWPTRAASPEIIAALQNLFGIDVSGSQQGWAQMGYGVPSVKTGFGPEPAFTPYSYTWSDPYRTAWENVPVDPTNQAFQVETLS